MNQSQSQSQSQSLSGNRSQTDKQESASPHSSDQENAAWANGAREQERRSPGQTGDDLRADEVAVDRASTSTEEPDTSPSHTPAGYGDRGQGGEPELSEGAPTQAEQPGRERMAPDGEHARQAGQAERNSGAFIDE